MNHAKDDTHVYYRDTIIEGADPETFSGSGDGSFISACPVVDRD